MNKNHNKFPVLVPVLAVLAVLSIGAVDPFRRAIVEVSSYIDATAYKQGGTTYDLSDIEANTDKLATIETGAKDDQTGAEIKALYEAEADTNAYTDADAAKVGYLAVTQAVDLDAMETDTAANNAKVTNATHTGEVVGSGALALDKTAITNRTEATIAAGDRLLFSDGSDSNNLKFTYYENLVAALGGGDALISNGLDQFASTDSSEFAGVISDETGTGAVVLANSPALVTPDLGTPTALDLANATGLPLDNGVIGTLAVGNGGTGIGTLGDALQILRVNSGGTALEFVDPDATDYQVEDSIFRIMDDLDSTKELAFQVSGIATGTTRNLTFPDSDIDFGDIPDALISNTLTASKYVGSGSISDGVDLATNEVFGDLPYSRFAQQAQATMLGRARGAGTGDTTALDVGQVAEMLHTPVDLFSSGGAVAWAIGTPGALQYAHTLTENTTISAPTGTPTEGRLVMFVITQSATARTLAWNSAFVAEDRTNGSIPAMLTGSGDVVLYGYRYFAWLSKFVLIAHVEIPTS